MPVNKSALSRYKAINQCLVNKQHKYPDLEYLAAKCSAILGKTVSTSCIEKDLRAMRESTELNYLAPISYHKTHRGYYYAQQGYSISELQLEDEEWEALRYAAALLNQYKEVPVFAHFRSAIERINTRFDLGFDPDDNSIDKFVQYETPNSHSGYEQLVPLFQAIRARQPIRFTYENIYKDTTRSYELDPYMLKEIRNRWYVAGWSEERNQFLVFALDRMHNPTALPKTFRRRGEFNPDTWFRHSVGIMDTGTKPEKVNLQISAPFHRLLKLEPLHPSQQLTRETGRSIRLEITVDLNPELCGRLLSMGPACKVLSPKKLVDKMKVLVQEMAEKYKR